MKRFIAVLLALVMIFALCACGQQASEQAEKPLSEEANNALISPLNLGFVVPREANAWAKSSHVEARNSGASSEGRPSLRSALVTAS